MVRIESSWQMPSLPPEGRDDSAPKNATRLLPTPDELYLKETPPHVGANSPLRSADPRSNLSHLLGEVEKEGMPETHFKHLSE